MPRYFLKYSPAAPKPLTFYPAAPLIIDLLCRDAWDEIIERCEAVGVDAFEINFSCPHGMPERKMGMVSAAAVAVQQQRTPLHLFAADTSTCGCCTCQPASCTSAAPFNVHSQCAVRRKALQPSALCAHHGAVLCCAVCRPWVRTVSCLARCVVGSTPRPPSQCGPR